MCDGMVAFQPTALSLSPSVASSWPARRLAATALLLLLALLPQVHASGKTNTHTHNMDVCTPLFSLRLHRRQSKLNRLRQIIVFLLTVLQVGLMKLTSLYALLSRVALPSSSSREIITCTLCNIHSPP